MKIYIYSLIAILALTFSSFGQFTKGDSVVPKFTSTDVKFEKLSVWTARNESSATISRTSDGLYAINGKSPWGIIFPSMTEYKIDKFETSKKKPTKVLLKNTKEQIEIIIPNDLDIQDVLANLLHKGTPETFIQTDYFKQLEARLLAIVFSGDLKSIPFEKQSKLMRIAHYKTTAFGVSEFKDKTYFRFEFSDSVIYNTLQLNQAERVARQTESAIKQLKSLYQITGKIENIEGIKLITDIYSRSFLDKLAVPQVEHFEMYVPFGLLQKFIDAEITTQDLADGSIILVNESRVKANLTNF